MRTLDYSEIESTAMEVTRFVDERSLLLGLEYFLEKRVGSCLVDGSLVFARVSGTQRTPYTVQLDLVDFRKSHCTCPNERFCKHMAAVFFHLYDDFGDPVTFINAPPSSPTHRANKRPTASAPEPSLPVANGPFSAWLARAEFDFARIAMTIPQSGYLMQPQTHFIAPLCQVAEEFPAEAGLLYRSFVMVFLAHQCDLMNSHAGRLSYGYYVISLAQRLQRVLLPSLLRVAQDLSAMTTGQTLAENPVFQDMCAYVRQTLVTTEDIDCLALCYSRLWLHFPRTEDRLNEEIASLLRASEGMPVDAPTRQSLTAATATLYFVAGDDVRAADLMAQHPQLAWFTAWLEDLRQREAWERLANWLSFADERDASFDPKGIAPFADHWIAVAVQVPAYHAACAAYLESHMPYTWVAHDAFLLATEQHRLWVDTWMMRQTEPTQVDKEALTVVERTDRTVLLPWYHQAVERAIREKNRNAYKRAVRMLKKLRTHYKKLKRAAEFDDYLANLRSRYARLRALHEEMARKGLIEG